MDERGGGALKCLGVVKGRRSEEKVRGPTDPVHAQGWVKEKKCKPWRSGAAVQLCGSAGCWRGEEYDCATTRMM